MFMLGNDGRHIGFKKTSPGHRMTQAGAWGPGGPDGQEAQAGHQCSGVGGGEGRQQGRQLQPRERDAGEQRPPPVGAGGGLAERRAVMGEVLRRGMDRGTGCG